MVPLIEIEPDGRLEGGHDALGEFEPGAAIAELGRS